MRQASSPVEASKVRRAKEQFSATAAQQRKLLIASGIEPPRVCLQLMDQLVQHRLDRMGSAAAGSSSEALTELQTIFSATGFTPAQAARTLLLKQEITHLRGQGNSTAEVIQKLDHRLRAATGLRRRNEENQIGSLCHPQKKLKLSDERLGGVTTFPASRTPADPRIWPTSTGRSMSDKRPREDGAPPPTRGVKVRLSSVSSVSSVDGGPGHGE